MLQIVPWTTYGIFAAVDGPLGQVWPPQKVYLTISGLPTFSILYYVNLLLNCLVTIASCPRLNFSCKHSNWITIGMQHTINRERVAGLNFHVFHSFQEYCESFLVNINGCLLIILNNKQF